MMTIEQMKRETMKGNKDNISRTEFYEQFYFKHPEIKWALLASFVSRNAGWNMTDLESDWISEMVSKDFRHLLFKTFERANWTIFADAYPQLLWYEFVKESGKVNEELLHEFQISTFMQKEWKHFLREQDEERLCTALIINEQYTIENTVMKHPFYRKNVFNTITYVLEEHAHMSYVIFPTRCGDLYGYYVRHFKDVKARIWLGKQLQNLLFHPSLYPSFIKFAKETPPTGSRRDYQQYTSWRTGNSSPTLRSTYPIVFHEWKEKEDWSLKVGNLNRLFRNKRQQKPEERTKWLQKKWYELYMMKKVYSLFNK